MAADQFRLQWQNHQTNVLSMFQELFEAGILTDVTVSCEGHCFHAHKVVLSACSDYFKNLFTSLPSKDLVVFMRDVSRTDMEDLLSFMYCGEVTVSQPKLASLLKLAENLHIKGLGQTPSSDEENHIESSSKKRKYFVSESNPDSTSTSERSLDTSCGTSSDVPQKICKPTNVVKNDNWQTSKFNELNMTSTIGQSTLYNDSTSQQLPAAQTVYSDTETKGKRQNAGPLEEEFSSQSETSNKVGQQTGVSSVSVRRSPHADEDTANKVCVKKELPESPSDTNTGTNPSIEMVDHCADDDQTPLSLHTSISGKMHPSVDQSESGSGHPQLQIPLGMDSAAQASVPLNRPMEVIEMDVSPILCEGISHPFPLVTAQGVTGSGYSCPMCHRNFAAKHHLQYHIRTHTGEKPYKCDICGLAFSQQSNMYRHKRTQHAWEAP